MLGFGKWLESPLQSVESLLHKSIVTKRNRRENKKSKRKQSRTCICIGRIESRKGSQTDVNKYEHEQIKIVSVSFYSI